MAQDTILEMLRRRGIGELPDVEPVPILPVMEPSSPSIRRLMFPIPQRPPTHPSAFGTRIPHHKRRNLLTDDEEIQKNREYWSQLSDMVPGMIEPGNIDHIGRPEVSLGDGRAGTVHAMSFEEDGREVLIPTIYNGEKHTDEQAIKHYYETGEHLGVFETPDQATAFSKALSNALGDQVFAGPPRPR